MINQINLVNMAYRKVRHPLNALNMLLGAGAVACGAIGYAVRGLLRRPARK